MNANNRKVQYYAGLIQVSNSVFILADALAMSLMQAWGCDTGVPYICAASSFIGGTLALRCSMTPTPRLRRLSHALSFMNLGVVYGFGMVMLGTFGFLLDHKRHYPLTLLSVHMAYTLFGLVNICCAIMQVKSVSLKPVFCFGRQYEAANSRPSSIDRHQHVTWCTCGSLLHPSDYSLASEQYSFPSQLHVFCTDYSPTFAIDAEIMAPDHVPASTPPPPYDDVVDMRDAPPPYEEEPPCSMETLR